MPKGLTEDWLAERRFGSAAVFWVLIALAFTVLYSRLVISDPILSGYDDPILIGPLRRLSSIGDYLQAVQSGRIYDVQPVRDLSLWLDLQAKQRLPFASFHLTNVLIWLATVFLVYCTLLRLRISRSTVYAATALYSVHPVFMNSVAWISARKHLLSALFIVAATYLVVDEARGATTRGALRLSSVIGISALYFLSCFSQPINVLWPAFGVVYLMGHGVRLLRDWRGIALVFSLAAIGASCAYLNQRYYTGIYLAQSGGVAKYVDSAQSDLGIRLLAFGRYFLQIIFPAWPCVSNPYPGSLRNIAGLLSFPVFGLFLKKYGNRECGYWLFYFLLALAPVLLRMTNVFESDTYLLNASLGILIALVSLRPSLSVVPKPAMAAFGLVLLLFFAKSFELSRAWGSDLLLWENSYRTEATPMNATKYGLYLLGDGQSEAALALALRVKEWKPEQSGLSLLFAKAVYLQPTWSADRKISVLEGNPMNSPWFHYYLAALYASQSRFDRASSEMRSAMADLDRYCLAMAEDLETATAEAYYFCIKSGERSCEPGVSKIRAELQAHSYLRYEPWDDSRFVVRLKRLGLR